MKREGDDEAGARSGIPSSAYPPTRSPVTRLIEGVGAILGAWLVLLALENVVIGLGFRDEFVGSWEMAHARRYLTPVALAAAFPLAIVAALLARLAAAGKLAVMGALGGAAGLVLAIMVSTGRHMQSLAARAPFVIVAALVGAVASAAIAKYAVRWPPRVVAVLGALTAIAGWVVDAFVLPRLYPAFHTALLMVTLLGWASLVLAVGREHREGRAFRGACLGVAAVSILAALFVSRASRAVAGDDNLRRILVEHAPLLGRTVTIAARITPPAPMEDDDVVARTIGSSALRKTKSARALDWTGRDIVLVTIDALRADHVSSYGYHRPTTPNIDRLAMRGARFEHAYCPTPHTSYSVTSMMTGKYMRPLLTMGAGQDSVTWAGYLRQYGFRTAAFYPPAVFFIDEHRFDRMKTEGLGFEYRKEEFADPALRRAQVAEYVRAAPKEKPLFLWVHLFEPHEPYVVHAEHVFGGDANVDRYDSEVAAADAVLGSIVDVVEERGRGAVFMVSADHGEEFGDHGGRYHGTTVYEEQVRVPLVVVGPGVPTGVVRTPVQTIDLLPTTLSALDVPLPARIRGRDVGALLAEESRRSDPGLAFAETDEYTLAAEGTERLVCLRKIASCTLFDVATDPLEKRPIVDRPARATELRRLTAAIERENGKLEASGLPDALRRGLQGDLDAAEDVATLFDDARADIRREAARCAFRLRAPQMATPLQRALTKDEDDEVKSWSALALYRLGDGASEGARERVAALLRDQRPALRLAAALVFAEHGDARGEAELVERWAQAFVPSGEPPRATGELGEAREILNALAKIRARSAAPVLVRSLGDARVHRYVADALGEIGDPRALPALLTTFATERYVDARPREARALLRLGARDAILEPLRRFAGMPDPMLEAVDIAREAGLLIPARGGWSRKAEPSAPGVAADKKAVLDSVLSVAGDGPARLLVSLTTSNGSPRLPDVRIDGAVVELARHGDVAIADRLPLVGSRARVTIEDAATANGIWLVRHAEELPPPAPKPWQPSGSLGEPAKDVDSDHGASRKPPLTRRGQQY